MKKHIREYLDMQVEEKKRMQNFEINLDHEQARVWKIDCENFHNQEKDINQKVKIKFIYIFILFIQVRALNYINSQYLKSQVDSKKNKDQHKKMNDEEYALNQDILEKIKTVNSNFRRNTTTFT
jgi:Na+-transporting methylmalonyl-CoA/oxaloacetate decarboxylase gamma subunit